MTAKRTSKRTKKVDDPAPVKMRATTAIRHGALRVAAGAIVDADAEIVARCPGLFEPVEGAP